ncbi:hypothetical protein [uncultured Algimonas sp.]|uniref:DUF7002 family protein n=1 Tax=uncultured Algimonas sp. TaxID=1547920 RepID=UPI002630892C|nr:hypothetical protein [uncultured Algimonas sp.]
MAPEALAARHPRLFHQTAPDAWPGIRTHGLLPTTAILQRLHLPSAQIDALTHYPRPHGLVFEQTPLGRVEINDNRPLSHAALERCLDDGLSPQDWCAMLAARTFFWADEHRGLSRLLNAKTNRDRPRDVLVIDTLSLARAHRARIQLSPINSGATIRKAARRGMRTFAPMRDFDTYAGWAALRGRRDTVLEVVVPGAVPDLADHVTEVRRYANGSYRVLD